MEAPPCSRPGSAWSLKGRSDADELDFPLASLSDHIHRRNRSSRYLPPRRLLSARLECGQADCAEKDSSSSFSSSSGHGPSGLGSICSSLWRARGMISPPCFASLPGLEWCVLIFHRNDLVIPLFVTGSNSLAIQPRGGVLLRLEDQLLRLDAVHNVDDSTRSVFGHEGALRGA